MNSFDRVQIKENAKRQLGGKIFSNSWMLALAVIVIVGAVTGFAGTILPGIGAILITGPLAYAVSYLFVKQARDGEAMDLTALVKGFTDDFGGNFLIGLMSTLFIALWSLLFVIPGIVKYYAYSMAYYVKADHPEYSWSQCIDESKRITAGHKMDLFIMDLSFIGWLIVGSLCFGIGTLWVAAYKEAAKAQAYEAIK